MNLSFNQISELADTPWIKPTKTQVIACFIFAIYCAWFASHSTGWVPILDSANLMFHEAGHPIYGALFGEKFSVYGGTLGQLSFPIIGGGYFWFRRELGSFVIMLIWFFENFWNIARYMADARAQELPLVGGGEHDWTEIFSRWGVLAKDRQIAHAIRGMAWIGVLTSLAWLVLKYREEKI